MVSKETSEKDDEEQNSLRSVNNHVIDSFHNLIGVTLGGTNCSFRLNS
jgi:hypothetical protein